MPKYSLYYSTFSFWKQKGPKPEKKKNYKATRRGIETPQTPINSNWLI